MAKTYLQVVNSVLLRLKESTAISVSDSEETLLIGEFVNEAKEWLEDKHEWTSLRTTIQASLAVDDYQTSLTGAGSRHNIIQVINDTTDYEFGEAASYTDMNRWLTSNDQENQEPTQWDLNGSDANGDPVANFYPRSDGAYDINFNMIVPQDVLAVDSTKLIVPHMPVILYAYALAVEERGEEGGTTPTVLLERADAAAERAITMDKGTIQDEYVWEVL